MAVITTTTQNVSADGYNIDVTARSLAQSFVATASGTITALTVGIGYNNNGVPDGDTQVAIYSDSAGAPNTQLAVATLLYTNMPSDGTTADVVASLNTPPSMVNGTTYWVVWQPGTASYSGIHYFLAGGDNAASTYGAADRLSNGSWISRANRTYRAVITITAAGPTGIKTWDSVAIASVKTVNGVATGSIKTINNVS